METSPTALPSPTSHSSSSSSSSDNNGLLHSLPSPKTPTISTRPESSSNPYPTTFVQADTSSFKQVVQMLTGTPTITNTSSSPSPSSLSPTTSHPTNNSNNIPPIRSSNKSKLYERRNSSLKVLKMIHPLAEAGARAGAGTTTTGALTFSPSQQQHAQQQYSILSPSMLDFPALALSPVTPLIPDPFNRSPRMTFIDQKAEEMAIKEKGFYFHPTVSSPVSTPRDSEPRLLPLFPLTSPKSSGSH